MNAYLNYFVEANITLMVFLLCYRVLLNKETDFRLLRAVLITGILVSIIFPLIHVQGSPGNSPLTLGRVVPSYWLPEVVIGEPHLNEPATASFDFWRHTSLIYWTGAGIAGVLLLIRLIQLANMIRRSKPYRIDNLLIAESVEDKPTFSFFNFIHIGRAHELSDAEKQQVICHESVHARQWHSLDILLINILRTVFWFNPFINVYKKTFIQLHEFEADARAAGHSDVNKYCNLLARVALKSAGFTLANHFNNSLTLKRIEMMRTIKYSINKWKLAAFTVILPMIFFFISCQDQVGDDIAQIAQNSTHTLQVPEHIQARYARLKQDNPGKSYSLLELNETASQKLDVLRAKYGLPKSMEVFTTTADGQPVGEPITGSSKQELVVIGHRPAQTGDNGFQMALNQTEPVVDGQRTFAIMEFSEEASNIAEKIAGASPQDRVYTVVQEAPEFRGGSDSMMAFLRDNIRYPLEARQQGIEGTVYVSFVIQKDGSVTDANVIKGVSPSVDAEALRVVKMSPPWVPGRQNKQDVAVRLVLPIKFAL